MEKLLNRLAEIKTNLTQEVIKDEELKAIVEKNANEVIHTGNTGYGKELVNLDVFTNNIYEGIAKKSKFVPMFSQGFHGNNMNLTEKVRAIGALSYATAGSEWTTGAGALSQGTHRLASDNVTITQNMLEIKVDISDRMLRYSSISNLMNVISNEVVEAFANTLDSLVLNGDTVLTATGNINSDDQAPATTYGADHHTLIDNGLRKTALAGTENVDFLDVGALDFNDFINTRSLLDDYSDDLDNLLLIMNPATYNKTLTIDEFKNWYTNGVNSTVSTGALTGKLAGVDFITSKEFKKTEADGKLSKTAANNTKGGFIYVYKPAVQWGFGQPITLEIARVPGKGYQVIGQMEIGFTVMSKEVGQTSPSVALAINATV